MNKYDNILGANGDVTILPNYLLSKNQFLLKGPFEQKSNVICMSIEELRECFIFGIDSCRDLKGSAECFNEFLKSKGINI